jgi:hypothetical protein
VGEARVEPFATWMEALSGIARATPVCIDPSAEALAKNPDPEYWGCHTMLHRA